MRTTVLKILFFLLVTPLYTFSQVSIDLPINKSVFQRNNSNQATLYIAGTYQNPIVTSIQARLVTPGTSSPISGFDWQIIKSNPTKGQFQGQLNNVPVGWYTLEVRIVNTGSILSSSYVDRVGIGDVYLISGQSNAAGLDAPSSPIIPINFDEKSLSHNSSQGCSAIYPNFAQLSPITSGDSISITGETPWAYSRLGFLISQNLGVPVAFFNGAASGTSIENWVSSSNGAATVHPITLTQYCNEVGAPYNIFNKALKYYPSLFGIRAILWHQGEADNHLNTTSASYTSQLNTFIAKTRSDFGATIPWMVSRASYFNGVVDANIIAGQNAVISSGTQIFAGPNTDAYTTSTSGGSPGDRLSDSTHFDTQGLIKFADGLYNSISSGTFLTSSSPIPSKVVPQTTISVSNGNVTLTLPGGYSSYKWVPGNNINASSLGSSNTFTSSSGTYRCYLTDANGNVTMSQAVNVNNILSQQSISTSFVDSLFLSEYLPDNLQNPIGPVAFNKAVGGSADGDGSAMNLNAVSYTKGIGVHSGSEVVYQMKTGFHSRFKATIGIDNLAAAGSNAIFKVYGGNTLLYTSPGMTKLSAPINVNINIAGYSSIKLVVVENNGGIQASNQANWANARIIFDKPKNLTASNIFKKCIQLNWTAANDQNGIASYQLFKDDILETTVPAGTLNYTFDNLSINTSYKLSVKALDSNGFTSPKIDTTVSTVSSSILYSDNNQVCIGDIVVPTVTPLGGTFKVVDKPEGVTFELTSASTGAVLFGSEGFVLMRYTWAGTACVDSFDYYVGGLVKPAAPSVTNAGDSLMNNGTSLTFNASACSNGYSLVWYDQSVNSSITVSPNDTTSYFAFCKNSTCYSDTSNIVKVKVISDCPNSFNLVSSKDNLNYGSKSFYFNASQTINATNKLTNPTGATFKAGKNINLNPGFEINAGSVFSATIGGCP